ncbi:MAG: DUF2017 domain-containing protein [Actinomycetota bacterium]|nr:DUF2017 domain-containing protein [Actinomycetota bacterium]
MRLTRAERTLLRMLRAELGGLLEDPNDPDLRRLFPPAHEDAERAAEYRALVHDQLLDGRARALATFERTLDGDTLTPEDADAWLRVLNDLRLVLGTRLDVTEETTLGEIDPHHEHAHAYAVYAYLSWLQEQLVEALSPDFGGVPGSG